MTHPDTVASLHRRIIDATSQRRRTKSSGWAPRSLFGTIRGDFSPDRPTLLVFPVQHLGQIGGR
jgi:hypothetical protein